MLPGGQAKPAQRSAAFVIVSTGEGQGRQHHVRLLGGSGEVVMRSEDYPDVRDAEHVLQVVGEAVRAGARVQAGWAKPAKPEQQLEDVAP